MATEIKFRGLHSKDAGKVGTFAHAVARLIKRGGDLTDVMEDIGVNAVTETRKFLFAGKVKPRTTDATFARRKTRKKNPELKDTTLVDTGIGAMQVDYRHTKSSVTVGVPDGYMAYHQEGRVPNSPQRKFLVLPNSGYIVKLVNFHWHKVVNR